MIRSILSMDVTVQHGCHYTGRFHHEYFMADSQYYLWGSPQIISPVLYGPQSVRLFVEAGSTNNLVGTL
jgi:hypothetical protein